MSLETSGSATGEVEWADPSRWREKRAVVVSGTFADTVATWTLEHLADDDLTFLPLDAWAILNAWIALVHVPSSEAP